MRNVRYRAQVQAVGSNPAPLSKPGNSSTVVYFRGALSPGDPYRDKQDVRWHWL